MIDLKPQVVAALSEILPTYYELNLISGIETPCISYMELDNFHEVNGETLGYSEISFQIKVWGNDLEVLARYENEIDKIMRGFGFTRSSSVPIHDENSSMIQKVGTYDILVREIY